MELMVGGSIGMAILAFCASFTVFANGWIKSTMAQTMFLLEARYGMQRISHIVQDARSVCALSDGNTVYLLNPDNSLSILYFQNADGDLNTIVDNAIWLDPTPTVPGGEKCIVRHVTPLNGIPIFVVDRGNLVARFHVGDPAQVSPADSISGKGYQGVQMRASVQPRNIGRTWASSMYDAPE